MSLLPKKKFKFFYVLYQIEQWQIHKECVRNDWNEFSETENSNIHELESRYSGDIISVQKCMCVAFNRIWHNRANYDRTFDMVIQQLNPIDEKICTLKIVSNAFINALTKCFHRKKSSSSWISNGLHHKYKLEEFVSQMDAWKTSRMVHTWSYKHHRFAVQTFGI